MPFTVAEVKEHIADAIPVPEEDLPLPRAAILGFMGLLDNDIDTDGDGVKDALSLGLKVSGIDGVISGTY